MRAAEKEPNQWVRVMGDFLPEKKINGCALTKQSKISQHDHKEFLSEK